MRKSIINIIGASALGLILVMGGCAGAGAGSSSAAKSSSAASAQAASSTASSAPSTASSAASSSAGSSSDAEGYKDYEGPDGWKVSYNSALITANKIDDHSVGFVYTGESAGTNMVTISYVKGKLPNEVLSEITKDNSGYERTEGFFPGTRDKWAYWRTLGPAGGGPGMYHTLIGGEYNEGSLIFEFTTHKGSDEDENMKVGDTLAMVVDSIQFKDFKDQEMYYYYSGTYIHKDKNTGATSTVILNKDHTGMLKLEGDVPLTWGDHDISTDDGKTYEFSIEGENLMLNINDKWVDFAKN